MAVSRSLYTLTVHRIKVRYKQSVLGLAWAILQPLSLMLIYTVIFSVIAKVPSEGVPYAVFAYAALLAVDVLLQLAHKRDAGTRQSQPTRDEGLLRARDPALDLRQCSAIRFRRGLDFPDRAFFYYGVGLTIYALYAIPIMILLAAIATAFSLFLIRDAGAVFGDIGVAMPLLLQLWMFSTPVVYPLSAVPQRFRGLYVLNPLVGVIENFRRVVLQGVEPDFHSLAISAIVAAILLPLAYLYFKRVEATMADVI